MIEFLNEDRKKFKEYLIDFFHNAYNSDKLSSKDEIVNFDFLKNYGFCVKLSYGKGTISKIPWIIFIRTDTQEYKASYGIYVYCGIKRENGEIIVCIGESEDKTINYLAKNKVDDYNTQFNKKTYDYKNLNNDIDLIIDKIIENMQWFAKLPLNEIQDRNDLSKSNNKEIRNDGSEMSNKKENKNLSLNQILYGPPGTGKTYHTIDKALEILGENLESRDEKKAKFDEYVKNGQIVFTTFHQSYGYEEFVEGIKPHIDSEENSKEIKYEIKDGIFKELCEKALENRDSIKNFNFYIDKLKEKVKIDDNNPEKYFELPNTKYSIQYRNGKTFRIKFDDMSKNHKDYPVSIDNIEKLYKTSNIDEIYNSAYVRAILNYLKLQGLEDYKEKDEKVNLPYIIIIDEINRGNVSKIFGELITLIEASKRIGEKEELKVTLPYSGEKFGVPKNVYIIGTMNTADRSITSLDTALRRRFEFIEMMPDVSKLSMDCEGINLQELLKAINTRIEYLLDREKTIGHAFFISVENLESLKKVFKNRIIPLLQEYFYNDYALINAVLNDNGMIFEDKKDDKYLQKIKNLDSVNSERSIYNIASFDDKIWDKIEIYQAIYNDEIANKLKNENE
ncbi:AAA family ATPase [Campylobacter jejuni]|nr:AAA domain-containing protein [Campylobacter jejuni]EIA4952269.1 AAA family ATPase [Campylobacter jejuni]HED8403925.1 AAA family ATPase [Campylobacter jejuni]